jgi:hypothetical protein
VLLATVLFGFVFGGVEIPVLAMGAVVAAVLAASPRIDRTWFRVLAPTVLMAVIATDTLRPFILPRALRASRPVVTMTLQDPIVEYARTQTPQDAVFLTPPNYGLFRLAAQRAIVVDWKSMPFQDEGMLEWWRRMNDCYANVEGMKRKESLLLMERSYAAISTEKLLDLGRRYGAEYAIVDNDDPVSLKVLATNGRYELIRLNDPGSAR